MKRVVITPGPEKSTEIKEKKQRKKFFHKFKTKRFWFNTVLLVVGASLIAFPFLGEISYLYNKLFFPEKFTEEYYLEEYDTEVFVDGDYTGDDALRDVDAGDYKDDGANRVIIPSAGVDFKIYEGATDSILSKGVWIRPNDTFPGDVGNTILTGHKNAGIGWPGPFYNLSKASIGDKVIVRWEGEYYRYKVSDKFVVNPEDIWVEDQSDDEKVTIYTCKGLNAAERTVVIAEPI